MKKKISITLLSMFIVLVTAAFGYTEYSALGIEGFPYFHLGCLMVGGLIIVSLKMKYDKIYLSEAVGSFALYTLLITMFTSPVVNMLKEFLT
jgi:uncharacterized membrane protein YhdT